MTPYLRRIADLELDALLPALPAIALEGPKGVGKTATARRRAASVHQLDDPAQRAVAEADPARLTHGAPPILLDEWQHVPQVWDEVRRAVDAGAEPGRFLLTGSATPSAPPTHSGAGRIVTLRMRPLALSERELDTPTVSLAALLSGARPVVEGRSEMGLAGYTRAIVASGFPGMRGLEGRALRAQLDGYLDRVLDRDFVEYGRAVRKPQLLKRWLTAYAAATATTVAYERIRDAATGGERDKPEKVTTLQYRDVLERLWILDPVPGWTPSRNQFSRLTQTPKHHLADPALAARLLGVSEAALLGGESGGVAIPRDGTLLGHLFESLVTLSVRACAQAAEATVHHLRTREGRQEIDLIVQRGDQRVLAIEVKLGATVTDDDVNHLRWLHGKLRHDLLDAAVVTTGAEAYRRADGIAVIPAVLLGP